MPLWVRLHRSARLTAPAKAAAVLGERQLPQRLAVSGASLRVQERALARSHDASLPLAQAFGVQRVRARQVERVACSPSSAAGLLDINTLVFISDMGRTTLQTIVSTTRR